MTTDRHRKAYTAPQIEVIVLENLSPLLASITGSAPDSDDSEFGAPRRRRDSAWEELWNTNQ